MPPPVMPPRHAYTLLELLAAITIVGVAAGLVIPRVLVHQDAGDKAACHTNRAEIEVQAKLWRRNTGSYPNTTLNDVGANTSYFPEGLPTCPVDGTAYTIDTTTGLVIGHDH
ncbi:MAG: prepilin-type N-terminal cleavage/methylation domain-containing protein [Planctomycetota bacterium]